MGVTRKLRRAGVRKPRMVRREADKARLPLHYALAMLENETGIPQRNVFGCDWGPQGGKPPYCGDKVTKQRVHALINAGKANGVGWTQITYLPFVLQAERAGGAHKPRYQMRVGFAVLKDNIDREGSAWSGARAYNGSGPAAEAYANRWWANAQKWNALLKGRK